jgi:hypothetical protein
MPQCQFLFFAVFVFQKSYIGNILIIGRNKSGSSYLPERKTESRGKTEPDQEAATPWLCHQVVWAPGPPPDIALSPINSLRRENPKGRNTFPRNILQAATVFVPRSGRSRSSSRHLAGDGNHHWRTSYLPKRKTESKGETEPDQEAAAP